LLLAIDLRDYQLILHLLRKLDPCRSKFLAMSAPRSKEFDEYAAILDLVVEVSFIEFEDLAFWVQNTCRCFRCRGRRWTRLYNKVLVEEFLKAFEFPGFFESFDEFAVLVNVELWPPVDLQLPTFVLYHG